VIGGQVQWKWSTLFWSILYTVLCGGSYPNDWQHLYCNSSLIYSILIPAHQHVLAYVTVRAHYCPYEGFGTLLCIYINLYLNGHTLKSGSINVISFYLWCWVFEHRLHLQYPYSKVKKNLNNTYKCDMLGWIAVLFVTV